MATSRNDICINAEQLTAFATALLRQWGVSDDHAVVTAENLVAADLFGVSSHGVHMLGVYEYMYRDGRIDPSPETRIDVVTEAMLCADAGGGLGHFASRRTMQRLIDAGHAHGFAMGSVRNSGHFGAAGLYALQAAEHGLIALVTSSVAVTSLVPTHANRSWFGTNPIAFAAPSAKGHPFLLDMATTTSSIGRIMRAAEHGKTLGRGWALAGDGTFTTDAAIALEQRLLTPLGSTDQNASYKGYGLAAMVEILSTFLSGSIWSPQRDDMSDLNSARDYVGHFFLVIDPSSFRQTGAFERDMADMHARLRASPTFDSNKYVRIPGDLEFEAREQRIRDGIPLATHEHAALYAMANRTSIDADVYLSSASSRV